MTEPTTPKEDFKKYDRLKSVVKKLIDIENASAGIGHFSQATLDRSGIHELQFDDLNEQDIALLALFKDSLSDAIDCIDHKPDTITKTYIEHMSVSLEKINPTCENPTRNILRAYMNNKFAALFGYLQLFARAVKNNNDSSRIFAINGLHVMEATYLSVFDDLNILCDA